MTPDKNLFSRREMVARPSAEPTLDWRVLGLASGLAILTCILFGLTPAMQASRAESGGRE